MVDKKNNLWLGVAAAGAVVVGGALLYNIFFAEGGDDSDEDELDLPHIEEFGAQELT